MGQRVSISIAVTVFLAMAIFSVYDVGEKTVYGLGEYKIYEDKIGQDEKVVMDFYSSYRNGDIEEMVENVSIFWLASVMPYGDGVDLNVMYENEEEIRRSEYVDMFKETFEPVDFEVDIYPDMTLREGKASVVFYELEHEGNKVVEGISLLDVGTYKILEIFPIYTDSMKSFVKEGYDEEFEASLYEYMGYVQEIVGEYKEGA